MKKRRGTRQRGKKKRKDTGEEKGGEELNEKKSGVEAE